MIMKKTLAALFVIFFSCASFAYEVNFSFAGPERDTNFIAVVSSGDNFTYKGSISEGCDLTRLLVSREPDQLANQCALLSVGLGACSFDIPVREVFADDAWVIRDYLSESFFADRNLYDNENAKKDVIRNQIRSAATAFEKDDIFFFYYSGYVSPDAQIACYDDYYSADELASDLSLFKDGVVIIVMLDADNSNLIAGKGILKDNKNFLLITSTKNMPKKWKRQAARWGDEVSPFTLGLWRSFNDATDLDGNGLLSFLEYYKRAKAFLNTKKLGNELSISNEELASRIYLSPLCSKISNASITYKTDSPFELTLPNVTSDVNIYLEEGAPNEELVMHPLKSTISANIKEAGPAYPTKFSLVFNVGDIPELDDFAFDFGNYRMPFPVLLKETERGITIGMEDYDFNVLATAKMSLKKGYLQLKLNLKGNSQLPNVLKQEEGFELVPLQMRVRDNLSTVFLPYLKKYKAGKTFSAKLEIRK